MYTEAYILQILTKAIGITEGSHKKGHKIYLEARFLAHFLNLQLQPLKVVYQ